MTFRLSARGASDKGEHRATNQDAAFAASWAAGVADGVGGGPAGDLASAAFVHRLVSAPMHLTASEELVARVREANWDLRAHVERDPSLRGMATTFTALFAASGDRLLLAHTGDSRGYLLRDGIFSRQTRDDSYVQALVDRGLITPEEAQNHPRRNIITASLGGGESDSVGVIECPYAYGDRWLLCSDGVSDYVPEDEITRLLASGTPGEAAEAIVGTALAAGTLDNATAVVCDIVEGTADGDERPAFYGAAAGRFDEDLDIA